MKKLFCIADVHSFYAEMILSLNQHGFEIDNPDHIIVHCGDLLDRGPKALDCLNFINSLPKDRKILIRGNHEDLLEEALNRGRFYINDYHNGTIDTCSQLSDISVRDMLSNDLTLFAVMDKVKNRPELITYLDSLVDYFEIDNYLFVHGWVPTEYNNGMPIDLNNEDYAYWKNGDWREARWKNGMAEWRINPLKNKTVVCGHYHTSWGHSHIHKLGVEFDVEYNSNEALENKAHFEPFVDEGIIAIDGCTAYSGIVNCYIIEVEEEKWRLSM